MARRAYGFAGYAVLWNPAGPSPRRVDHRKESAAMTILAIALGSLGVACSVIVWSACAFASKQADNLE
jgi:hypothetical protein